MTNEEVRKASGRRTRRSFLIGGAAAVGGYEFYRWIARSPQDQLIPRPLRKALDFDAKVTHGVFDERGLAPTFPMSKAQDLRINGNYGLKQDLVADSYRLQVVGVDRAKVFPQYVDDVTAWNYKYAKDDAKYEGHDTKVAPKDETKPATPQGSAKDMKPAEAGAKAAAAKDDDDDDSGADKVDYSSLPPAFQKAFAAMQAKQGDKPSRGNEEAGESDSTLDPNTPGLLLKVGDVTRFQKQEFVTQFKCIEGWSEYVYWGGVRLKDFIEAYPPARNAQGELPKYVYMETPNGDYYCGFHLEECMHPQSLLVTEMSGKPLTQAHGAPLRLHMPIKYGYKQIKRIGLIAYMDEKPDDYWTRLGYDWYAGL